MSHDLVIRDALIVTPAGRVEGDLAVEGGTIAAIGRGIGRGREEIDAAGRILLPGGIDSHCHVAQRAIAGEPPCPDDFLSGTAAAALGGTTTIAPHAMCPRGADQEAVLREYLAEAPGRALVDYAVHLQMPEADPRFLSDTLPRLADEGFTSLKIFSTYEGYALRDPEILAIMAAAAPLDLLVILHAEDDALVRFASAREAAAGAGPDRQTHARPPEAEAEMIHRVATYAGATGARLHVFHVSGRPALDELARARARGVALTAETCAHYLSFTAADTARPAGEGARFLCSPPLREAEDRDALWDALASGALDTVSSDHSPSHRLDQIARARAAAAEGRTTPFTAFSGGIPGLATLLPAVFSGGVATGRLTLERFAEVTAAAPARLLGLWPAKGALAEGADADLALWDPAARWRVTRDALGSRVDFTPWEGEELTGRPVLTACRGRVVMRDGRIDPAAAGHGRLAPRGRPS